MQWKIDRVFIENNQYDPNVPFKNNALFDIYLNLFADDCNRKGPQYIWALIYCTSR